jgi:ketosteroid isomerase-like protein
MEASSPELERLLEVYDAFCAGSLERISEFFAPDASYRPSGVFPGMRDRYVGHEGVADLWHASTEPWEWIRIETGQTLASGTDVVAQIWLHGRGRESQVEVHGVEAGHLVRFRDLKIVEFLAFPTYEEALAELGRE